MGDVAFVVPSAHLVTEIEVLDVDGFPVETEAPIQWTGTMHKASVSAPAGSEVTLRYRAEDLYHRDLGWSQEMSPGIVASDAQNVPEPGLTASLIVGGLFLAWAGKRRTKR